MNDVDVCKMYCNILEDVIKFANKIVKEKNDTYFASFTYIDVGSFYVIFHFDILIFDKYLDPDEDYENGGFLDVFVNYDNDMIEDVYFACDDILMQ